jgi:hypothetical protein
MVEEGVSSEMFLWENCDSFVRMNTCVPMISNVSTNTFVPIAPYKWMEEALYLLQIALFLWMEEALYVFQENL